MSQFRLKINDFEFKLKILVCLFIIFQIFFHFSHYSQSFFILLVGMAKLEREKHSKEASEQDQYTPVSQPHDSSLLSMDEVNRLGRKSDVRGLSQLFFHGGILVLTGAALMYALERQTDPGKAEILDCAFLFVALLSHSFVLSFLFMPLHECVHRTAFSSPLLNVSLSFLLGFLTFRPPYHYKYYHVAHHKFTGDKKRDPELSGSLLDLSITSLPLYFLYLSSLPFWFDRTMTLLTHALCGARAPYLSSSRAEFIVTWESRIFLFLYALLFSSCHLLSLSFPITLWLVPTLLAQPFLRFYLLAEHTGCPSHRDMRANTRTTHTYWLYRKLAWQMPYHSQHHAWPSVPFHALPTLYERVREKESEREKGSEKERCEPSGEEGYWSIHMGIVRSLLRSR